MPSENGEINYTEVLYNHGMCSAGSNACIVGAIYINSTCKKDFTCYLNPMYVDVAGKVYITDNNAVKKIVKKEEIKNANFTPEGLATIHEVRFEGKDMELTGEEGSNDIEIYIQVAKYQDKVTIEALDKKMNVIQTVTYNAEDVDNGIVKKIKKADFYRLNYGWAPDGELHKASEMLPEGAVWGYFDTVDYDGIIQREIHIPDTIIE